jgi:hypothetical protein
MPVGEMLRQMDSREIMEWKAFFILRRDQANKPKSATPDELKALFASRVIKKKKD